MATIRKTKTAQRGRNTATAKTDRIAKVIERAILAFDPAKHASGASHIAAKSRFIAKRLVQNGGLTR